MSLQHKTIPAKVNRPASVEKMMKEVISLPFWVKQYIYLNLRDNLRKQTDVKKLDDKSVKDLVQMFVATPTPIGQRYIKGRVFNNVAIPDDIAPEQIEFLKSLGVDKKLIDICNEKQWSLMKCCTILVECIEHGLVEAIDNSNTANTVYYLAGKIRLGEYLLRMNKISLQQVDRALYTQKQIFQQVGTQTKIGDLLVNLGFIKESDKNDILSLKENSDIICDLEDETQILKDKIEELQKSNDLIKFENESLKQDLELYQHELVEKARLISELTQQIENRSNNNPSLLNWFQKKLNFNRT